MAETRIPTPKAVAPHVARSTAKREIKVFTVELTTQFEGAIPAGWTPFHAASLGGPGQPVVLIYAYK